MDVQALKARFKLYLDLLRRNLIWFVLAGVLGLVVGIVIALNRPAVYTAVTTFHPETNQKGTNLPDDPLSLFLGTTPGDQESEQMIGVLKSRTLSEMVTGDTVLFQGKRQLVADLVLEVYPIGRSLARRIQNWFQSDGQGPTLEKKVIASAAVMRRNLEAQSNDHGFIELSISAIDPQLVQLISEHYIENLREYYRANKTEKAKRNLIYFDQQADSVRMELESAKAELVQAIESTKYGVRARGELQRQEKEAAVEFYAEIYIKTLLNKVQAEAQLQQDIPVIQVLDHPNPPFKVARSSWLVLGLGGAILFMIIVFVLLGWSLVLQDVKAFLVSSLEAESQK